MSEATASEAEIPAAPPGEVFDVRRDFLILNRLIDGKPLVYMDSAATSLKPVCDTSRMSQVPPGAA